MIAEAKKQVKTTMENQQVSGHPMVALAFTLSSVISGAIASIMSNIDTYLRVGAGLIAIVSGVMAIRYYYYATKEKLKNIKQ